MNKEALEQPKTKQENLNQWQDELNNIFPTGVPEMSVWTTFSEIVNTLKFIGEGKQTCMILTSGLGNIDLKSAEPAIEPDCINLSSGGVIIIAKPERLIFQSFPNQNREWSYFRLETATLQPVTNCFDEWCREKITLLQDGEYDPDPSIVNYFDSVEEPELIGCRSVFRYTKSSLVIFVRSLIDNKFIEDSLYKKMNTDDYREFISEMINQIAQKKAVEHEEM